MRNILLVLISIFATSSVFAQKLYTRNDSILITQDSITIKAASHKGNIQWQRSLDNKTWINLEGKTTDSLKVKPDVEAIYRAKVAEGTCLPVYSDSVAVVTADTITKNYIDPSKTGLILISDTTKISNGNYIYTGADNSKDFEIGKVIIDEQSGGTIRRIIDVQKQGDTLSVKTIQANLEDLFQGASFKLSTNMVYPSQNLKNASLKEIGMALTDKDGYIHPMEVIYSSETGTRLKSTSIFSKNKSLQGGSLYMHQDFAGTPLLDFHGPFSYKNEQGEIISVQGDVKGYVQQGYFTFDPEFKFEFEFEKPSINWRDLNISVGEIKKFAFYTNEAQIDYKNIIVTEWNVACILGKELTLFPNILPPVTLKYIVYGIPVWINFNVDLKCKLSCKLGTGSIVTVGYENANKVTIGARYENREWQGIKDLRQESQVILPKSLNGNIELKFDVYPSLKIKIDGVLGPVLNIGPNIKYDFQTSLNNQNWDKSLDLGVDATLGVAAEILGKKIISYTPGNWNLFSRNLFRSPDNLSLIGGDNQTGQPGKDLGEPIIVKVTDSENQPQKDVQVYFSLNSGSVSEPLVKTNSEGIAQVNWTLANNTGSQSLRIYVLDGKDQVIDKCSLYVYATAENEITNKPTVTTNPITNITQTSATSGGNITSDGGAPISASGICWSTFQDPTTSTNFTTDGNTSSFSSNLTGLTANTTYYVWAYATNSLGTAYGSEVSFTTSVVEPQSGVFTDNRDGHTYKWIKIGTQVWMAENLAYLPSVSPSSSGSESLPYYYVYGYEGTSVSSAKASSNYNTFGVLYNWPAAMVGETSSNSIPSGVKGISPQGWHLPSKNEFIVLSNFLGGQSIAGGKMKEIGTLNWDSPNAGANNESGFSALPSGTRFRSGYFTYLGFLGEFWTSTLDNYTEATFFGLQSDSSGLSVGATYLGNQFGSSIRCIKD